METRLCKCCGKEKDIEEFHCSGPGNGRKRTCKTCLNLRSRVKSTLTILEMIDIHKSRFNMGFPMLLHSHDFMGYRG